MNEELPVYKLIILMIICPPIGTYFVCRSERVHIAFKVLSVIYTAGLVLFLTTFHGCKGEEVIRAEEYVSGELVI